MSTNWHDSYAMWHEHGLAFCVAFVDSPTSVVCHEDPTAAGRSEVRGKERCDEQCVDGQSDPTVRGSGEGA